MDFEIEVRSAGELCEKLRNVTLRGSTIPPYLNSFIRIETFNPRNLSPCQRYALLPELKKIEELRWEILREYGQDILQLNGYLKCHYPDKTIDILPPVCEEYVTPWGELKAIINDGLHRVFLAYQMGIPVNVAYIRGVHPGYPYYAHMNPKGFDDIELIEEIPENYVKKFHVAKNHKELFRNFSSKFENVGDSRPRKQETFPEEVLKLLG